jgi:hypothetical protein
LDVYLRDTNQRVHYLNENHGGAVRSRHARIVGDFIRGCEQPERSDLLD